MKLTHHMREAIRFEARDVARRAWELMEQDVELSKQRVKDFIHDKYSSVFMTVLVMAMIKLAVAFIEYWLENNVKHPTLSYKSGEPDLPFEDFV